MKKKGESTFPSSGPRFTKECCFIEVSQVWPLCPCKSNSKWKWVWNIDGIIMTGESGSTGRKTCPNATLSTTNFTWTNLGLNRGLRDERPATKSPELCLKHEVRLNNWNPSSYRTENSTYPLKKKLLKLILSIWDGEFCSEFVWLRRAALLGCCESVWWTH